MLHDALLGDQRGVDEAVAGLRRLRSWVEVPGQDMHEAGTGLIAGFWSGEVDEEKVEQLTWAAGMPGAAQTGGAWQPASGGDRAPWAVQPGASRGRLHPEDTGGARSPYQRDRDRIIHSRAFRRLQYKTQVFVFHEGDYFRTRLTHSIEVAQIARSLARRLALDEDLAEALALAAGGLLCAKYGVVRDAVLGLAPPPVAAEDAAAGLDVLERARGSR